MKKLYKKENNNKNKTDEIDKIVLLTIVVPVESDFDAASFM